MPKCVTVPTDWYEKQLRKLDRPVQAGVVHTIKRKLEEYGSELPTKLPHAAEATHNDSRLIKLYVTYPAEFRVIYGSIGEYFGVEIVALLSVFPRPKNRGYSEEAGNVGEKAIARLDAKREEFFSLSEEEKKKVVKHEDK